MTIELIRDAQRIYVLAPHSAEFLAQIKTHGWEAGAMRAPARRLGLTRPVWSFDARRLPLVRQMVAAGFPGAQLIERDAELVAA
jgi:hypothetical protein